MNYAFEAYRLKNRIGSVVVPKHVAKKTVKLFLTPKRFEIKDWEKEAENKGERISLRNDLSAIRWSPEGSKSSSNNKQILLVHGWESRATQMYGLVKDIIDQGYTVIAVDMPGHGHSKGSTSNAYIFAQTVQFMQEKLGHFYAVIGHSMGAGATAIAVGKGLETDKLVLISGPSSIENVLRRFSGFVGLNKHTTELFVAFTGKHVGVPASELDASELLQGCDIPTLIIHDESDIEVPLSESKRLAPAFKRAELFITQGFGHRKILKADEVIRKIGDFLSNAA